MDGLGGQEVASEFEVTGGAGIGDHSAANAKITGSADGSIHGQVGHHASNDKMVDASTLQEACQRGVAETVGIVLFNDSFIFERTERRIEIDTASTREEMYRIWPCGDMLDMDNGMLVAAVTFQYFLRPLCGFRAFFERHSAVQEKVILEADQ